uniref:SFRICE_009799 n=1 Tax=Spodoptera frugiperda TaxID=7108 RepID=A0A2H1V5A0_SPOFR
MVNHVTYKILLSYNGKRPQTRIVRIARIGRIDCVNCSAAFGLPTRVLEQSDYRCHFHLDFWHRHSYALPMSGPYDADQWTQLYEFLTFYTRQTKIRCVRCVRCGPVDAYLK